MMESSPKPLGNSATKLLSSSSQAPATNLQPSGSSIQVELAVNVGNPEDLNKIEHLLKNDGYRLLSTDFESKTVRLELDTGANGHTRSVQGLQETIEKETGLLAVIKGVGTLASAVSELRPSESSIRNGDGIHGIIRLSQLDNNLCYVDGSFGREQYTQPRSHLLSLAIHEFGNLDGESYESIGDPIIDIVESESISAVSKTISDCNLAELIGRSIALTKVSPESNDRTVLSAGVVARASTIQQNKKQVCSCSGKTLWEERIDRKRTEQQGGQ